MFRSHRRAEPSALAPVGVLDGCPTAELELIAQRSQVIDLPAGRALCEQGAVGADCMLVETGHADVLVRGRKVATVGPGETIGEMGVLERRPRSATVIARTPMRIRVISGSDLDALTERTPAFTRALLRELSARVRDANRTLRADA